MPLPLQFKTGVIRDARESDVERIVQMVSQLADHHHDKASLNADDLVRDGFGEHPWVYVLVAEARGQLVGYAALYRLIQLQSANRGVDLHHLFVEPSFRGNGIGVALVEGCKLKGSELNCRFMKVGTDPENLEAQAFYRAIGFERQNSYPPRFVLGLDD